MRMLYYRPIDSTSSLWNIFLEKVSSLVDGLDGDFLV